MKRTPLQAPAKAKRNAPCPCGSGKKAKKCCLFDQVKTRAQILKMRREHFERECAEADSRPSTPFGRNIGLLAAITAMGSTTQRFRL
jgi:hypothetical protein